MRQSKARIIKRFVFEYGLDTKLYKLDNGQIICPASAMYRQTKKMLRNTRLSKLAKVMTGTSSFRRIYGGRQGHN